MSMLYSKIGLKGALASVRDTGNTSSPALTLLMAERAFNHGNLEEVEELLDDLTEGSLRLQALILRARTEFKRERDEAGCSLLTLVITEFGPRAVPADLLAAYARHLARQSGAASAIAFLEGVDTAPIAELITCRSVLLARLRRFEEAGRLIRNWIGRLPEADRPALAMLMGRLALLEGDPARAVRIFSSALQRLPASQRAYIRAARAAYTCCYRIVAVQWLRVAQALGPSTLPIHQLAARINILNGDLAGSAHSLRLALNKGGSNEDRTLLAGIEIQAGRQMIADTLLGEVLSEEPQDPAANFWVRVSASRRTATQTGRQAEPPILDPTLIDPELTRLFGILLLESHSPGEAASCFTAVLARTPLDEQTQRYLARCESSLAPPEPVVRLDAPDEITGFPIPASYQLRPEALTQSRSTNFGEALATQVRVISAIALRETRTRFAKSMLGHLWVSIEMIFVVFTHALFWYMMGTRASGGLDTFPFLTTGILPFFMFQAAYNKTLGVIKANRSLLSYPNITPLDIALARLLLEFASTMIAFWSCVVLLNAFGNPTYCTNPMEVLLIFLALSIMGFGVGLIVESLAVDMESIKVLCTQSLRLLYFVSTIFYPFSSVPSPLQPYFWWNPIIHAVSLIRYTFSSTYYITGMSVGYIALSTLVLLGVGLIAERGNRRKVLMK